MYAYFISTFLSNFHRLHVCVYQTCHSIAVATETCGKPTLATCVIGGGPFVSRGDQV